MASWIAACTVSRALSVNWSKLKAIVDEMQLAPLRSYLYYMTTPSCISQNPLDFPHFLFRMSTFLGLSRIFPHSHSQTPAVSRATSHNDLDPSCSAFAPTIFGSSSLLLQPTNNNNSRCLYFCSVRRSQAASRRPSVSEQSRDLVDESESAPSRPVWPAL